MCLVKTECLCKDHDWTVTARMKEQMPHDSSSHVHLAAFPFLLEWREVDATTLQITPHQPASFWRQTQADLPEISPLTGWVLPALRLYLTTDAWMYLDRVASAACSLLFSAWHKQNIGPSIFKYHCFAPLISAIKQMQLETVPYTDKAWSTKEDWLFYEIISVLP